MIHIMYGKTKNSQVPSDAQARERLAIYVYEYLTHVGAPKTANLFLQEIGWEKEIGISDAPGFLHSWWCVFWDLYCASPERRDTSEHSTEAKAFHDYSSTSVPSMTSMPGDVMNQQGVHPGYFPPGSAPSPSPHHNPNNPMMRQPFMSPRYPPGAPRSGMQAPGPQSMLQGMDPPRQAQMMGMGRMSHPRGMPSGSMNPYGPEQFQHSYGGMRMPPSTMPGHSGMPMGPMPGRSSWSGPSGPPGQTPGVPPTTPMMRSPDAMNPDYGHMNKAMQHQQMPSSFAMGGSVPESMPSTTSMSGGPGLPVSTPNMTPGLNGLNGTGHDPGMMEGLPKSSPSNSMPMNPIGGPGAPPPMGPPGGTPRTPQDGEGDSFNMGTFNDNHQEQNESAEILKIKETMRQEAKRFETNESDGNPANEFGFMS